MKFPKSVPLPVFVMVIIVFALIYGSYVAGSSGGPAAQPVYITDGTGGNLADVVSVNKQGHLSVHLADSSLPSFGGQIYTRHMSFPSRPGLLPGQCYAAFVRGYGEFINAAVTFGRGHAGNPQVLVRIDPNPVWVETGGPGSTPVGAGTGFSRSGRTDVFGYGSPLGFKSYIGVSLCWHGRGRSNGFTVQITAASGDQSNPYLPEELRFRRKGREFIWRKLQGPKPSAYQVMGTNSTLVSYYTSFGTKPSPLPHLHHIGSTVIFVPHTYRFSISPQKARKTYERYYLFEIQPSGVNPTRVGPFGSFAGE